MEIDTIDAPVEVVVFDTDGPEGPEQGYAFQESHGFLMLVTPGGIFGFTINHLNIFRSRNRMQARLDAQGGWWHEMNMLRALSVLEKHGVPTNGGKPKRVPSAQEVDEWDQLEL